MDKLPLLVSAYMLLDNWINESFGIMEMALLIAH